MATINAHTSKTGQTTYRVRVQKKGYPTQTATFPSLREARRWATMIEGQIAEGRHFPQKSTHTLSELIIRYIADVMPHKTSTNQRREGFILRYWDRELGHRLLSDIHPVHIIECRDRLRKTRASGTVHRHLAVLSHLFTTALREYMWIDQNPCTRVSRPPLPPGRVRFLTDDERSRLLQECQRSGNKYLYGLVVAALYTGLRQGSLLSLTKKDVDSTARTLTIERTKNKTRLVLPLLGEAYALITERVAHISEHEYIFPNTGDHNRWESYRHAFNYAVKRANIPAFTFHCLRHSTASYLVQAGIPLYVVSQILSHKSVATTQRYAHLATENLKDALETLSQRLSS